MVERRNQKRKSPREPWRVIDRQSGELIGHVSNISSEGLMMRSEGPVPIDVLLNLRIEIPGKLDGCSELEFDAVSLWSDRGTNPRYYNTGLQLLNLTEQDLRQIERLIELCPV